MIIELLTILVRAYQKSPIKPFRRVFAKLYLKLKFRMLSPDRDKTVIAIRNGIKWELDLNEMIDRSIYYEGAFEPRTTAAINDYVKPGMTVLDIGANIGCHTLRFAKLVGQYGNVIAFEPITWAFRKLKRNLELNNFNNVILERMALSDESKGFQEVRFYASWPLDTDLYNRDKLHHIHHGRKMKDIVEMITLDDYVSQKGIKRIDFIKIDVDGMEYKVIRGGLNTIRKFKPIMLIEFGKYTLEECGDNLEDLVDILVQLNYHFYSLENLKNYESKNSLLNAVPPDKTINVLCIPSNKSSILREARK